MQGQAMLPRSHLGLMGGERWSVKKVPQLIGTMELLRIVSMTTGLEHTTGGTGTLYVLCYHGNVADMIQKKICQFTHTCQLVVVLMVHTLCSHLVDILWLQLIVKVTWSI